VLSHIYDRNQRSVANLNKLFFLRVILLLTVNVEVVNKSIGFDVFSYSNLRGHRQIFRIGTVRYAEGL